MGINNTKVNYFLIGAQKAGTSTLYSWIAQHPEVNAPKAIKDLHFFSVPENFNKGYAWFHGLFRNDKKKTLVHSSVNYLFHPEVALKIRDYNPNAKFLVVLRDPVRRAYSAYQFYRKLSKEKRSFHQAIEDEQNGRLESQIARDNFAYVGHGLYFQQLSDWFAVFSQDRFIILFYEDLFKNPRKFLPTVYRFLEVDTAFIPDMRPKNNTGSVRSVFLNNLIYGESGFRRLFTHGLKLKRLVPISWRGYFLGNFRDWNTKKDSKSEPISAELYEELSSLFKEDKQRLSKVIPHKDLDKIWEH